MNRLMNVVIPPKGTKCAHCGEEIITSCYTEHDTGRCFCDDKCLFQIKVGGKTNA